LLEYQKEFLQKYPHSFNNFLKFHKFGPAHKNCGDYFVLLKSIFPHINYYSLPEDLQISYIHLLSKADLLDELLEILQKSNVTGLVQNLGGTQYPKHLLLLATLVYSAHPKCKTVLKFLFSVAVKAGPSLSTILAQLQFNNYPLSIATWETVCYNSKTYKWQDVSNVVEHNNYLSCNITEKHVFRTTKTVATFTVYGTTPLRVLKLIFDILVEGIPK